ncbi:MAG: agmatine deiminase family protein [Candidatus Latescibacterota bacterium]
MSKIRPVSVPGEIDALGRLLFFVLMLSLLGRWLPSESAEAQNKVAVPGAPKYTAVPEYQRRMKRVVISLDWGRTSLDFRRPLLSRLPEYTEILLLMPRESSPQIGPELRNSTFGKRIQVIPYYSQIIEYGMLHFIDQGRPKLVEERVTNPLPVQFGTMWSQDLFEPVAAPGGKIRLITAPAHLCWWTEGGAGSGKPVSDNRYLEAVTSKGLEKSEVPVVFKGGNILIAEVGGKRIALCGGDILHESRQARDFIPGAVENESRIAETLRKALGVDRAVFVVQGARQPKAMYHLDQALIPLAEGVVAVNHITGDIPADTRAGNMVSEASRWLVALRKELAELGFRIIDIDTPVQNVLRCDYFVNAIPFSHAKTGQKTILMPIFDDKTDSDSANSARLNSKRFESAGFMVIPVLSRTGTLIGGIHCLINVVD